MPPIKRGITGMSDYTLNETMATIRYELDDREIYNDIRSEIGIQTPETVVDADSTYNWQTFTRYPSVPPGDTVRLIFEANHTSATDWQIYAHVAIYSPTPGNWIPYYNYSIDLETIVSLTKYAVNITNTGGISTAKVIVGVKYKYLATERITHEILVPLLLTVRATDSTSIRKYGRRVMNLTWTEGTEPTAMQAIIDYYLARHKDPYAKIIATMRGKTDGLMTQFITRDVSDTITVVNAELEINADYFLNSISISDDPTFTPTCVWGLEEQRTEETKTLFVLDTSALDGAHILGS